MQVESKKNTELTLPISNKETPNPEVERKLTAVELGQQALEVWYDECLGELELSVGDNLIQYCEDNDFTTKALLYYDDLIHSAQDASYFEGLSDTEISVALRRINERAVEDSYCYYRGERCINGYPDGPFDPIEAFKDFDPNDDGDNDEVDPDTGYDDEQDITIIINIIFNFDFDSSYGSCIYTDYFGETQIIPNGGTTLRMDGTELNCINGYLISDF